MASGWYKEFMSGYGFEIGGHKPNPRRYDGPPMDLANMRKNGVRSLRVDCLDCHRHASVNVDSYAGDVPVPSFAKRMRCSQCGSRNVTARPDWS